MNRLEKFFLKPPRQVIDNEVEYQETLRNARIAMYASLASGILVTLFSLVIYLKAPEAVVHWQFQLVLFAGVCSIGSIFYLRSGIDRYKIPAGIVLLFMVSILPIRMLQTGGVYSASNSVVGFTLIFAAILFGTKRIWLFALYWVVISLFVMKAHSLEIVRFAPDKALLFSTLTNVMGIVLIVSMLTSFVKVQAKYKKQIVDIERQKTLGLIVVALSHEINNPLFAAKLICQKGLESKGLSMKESGEILKSLDRIETVLREVHELKESKKEFNISIYEGKTEMLSLPSSNIEKI